MLLPVIVFNMITLIAMLITKFLWALALPFIYLFGHFALAQEIICIVTDLIDVVGLFYLLFIFVIAFILYRNFSFQIFFKKVKNLNFTGTLNAPILFWGAIKSFLLSLLNKFKSYFNKK